MTRDPIKAQRDRDILQDRIRGLTYDQLAETHGVSKATAHRVVVKYCESAIKPAAEELRLVEIDRLDKYLRTLDPFVERGSARHIEIALRVGERRAKLLGLDTPEQVEHKHTVETQAERELRELLQEADRANAIERASQVEPA